MKSTINASGRVRFSSVRSLVAIVFAAFAAAASIAQTTVTINSQTRRLMPTVPYVVFPPTGLRLDDSDQSHQLTFSNGSNLTAARTFTIYPGDSDRSLTLQGNPTLADWFDQSVKSGSAPTFVGTNFSGLNASNLSAGTVPDGRFPSILPAVSGASLTNLNASNIASGTVVAARLGTGSSITTKFLRGDNSWQALPGGGDMLATNNLADVASVSQSRINLGVAGSLGTLEYETLRTTQDAVIVTNQIAFSDGSEGWTAAPSYANTYIADFWLVSSQYPQKFSAAQIYNIYRKFIDARNGSGVMPLAINSSGAAAVFYASFNSNLTPGSDPIWLVPLLMRDYYQRTGDTTNFSSDLAIVNTAMAAVPRHSSTQLVSAGSAGTEYATWGFQDAVKKTGADLMGSLLCYQADLALVTLYTAIGNTAQASAYQTNATAIANDLTGVLWNSGAGMFNAASGTNAQIDVNGSALAVWLGIASVSQTASITAYLNTNAGTLFNSYGYVRQSPTNWASEWAGSSNYDSNYWSWGNRWVLYAIKQANSSTAVTHATNFANAANTTAEYYVSNTPGGAANNLESPVGTMAFIADYPSLFTARRSAPVPAINFGHAGEIVLDGKVGFGGLPESTQVDVRSFVRAASGLGYGMRIRPALIATANSDRLVGLRINPMFLDNGKTSVSHTALEIVTGNVGVGTAAAAVAMDVVGSGRFSSRMMAGGSGNTVSTSTGAVEAGYDPTANGGLGWGFVEAIARSGGTQYKQMVLSGTDVLFLTGATSTVSEKARFNTNGNLLFSGAVDSGSGGNILTTGFYSSTKSLNGTHSQIARNTHANGVAEWKAQNDSTDNATLGVFGTTATTYRAIAATDGFLYSAKKIALQADGTEIKLGVGATKIATVDSSGLTINSGTIALPSNSLISFSGSSGTTFTESITNSNAAGVAEWKVINASAQHGTFGKAGASYAGYRALAASDAYLYSQNDIALQADGTKVKLGVGTAESGEFDNNSTSGETRFLLYDVTAGTLKRVSVGAADSGGSGYKVLRVPN